MPLPANIDTLTSTWLRRVRESQYVYYELGAHYGRLHFYIGIPSITLSAIVGTAVFALLDSSGTATIKLFLGLISIAAAVLTSLQTFLQLSERAEQYRTCAAEFSSIRRSLELFRSHPPTDENEMYEQIDLIRKRMDVIAHESPQVPSHLKKRLDREVKKNESKKTTEKK